MSDQCGLIRIAAFNLALEGEPRGQKLAPRLQSQENYLSCESEQGDSRGEAELS